MELRFPGGLLHALTLSYDDGVEQDIRLMQILDQAGIRATFNLNSGLFSPEGTIFPAGQIHRRLTEKQAVSLYGPSQHEVAVHGLSHLSWPSLPDVRKTHDIFQDRLRLETLFHRLILGAAYPYGAYDDASVEALRMSSIAYCRTVESSHHFQIPTDWLRLKPTCHHDDPMLPDLCERFLHEARHPSVFYLWGHAYEFEEHDNWQVIENFAQKMGKRDDIWYCTNIQLYRYVRSYSQLITSADGKYIHNPTSTKIWFENGGSVYTILPGDTWMLG